MPTPPTTEAANAVLQTRARVHFMLKYAHDQLDAEFGPYEVHEPADPSSPCLVLWLVRREKRWPQYTASFSPEFGLMITDFES